jgi:hypothetical protein
MHLAHENFEFYAYRESNYPFSKTIYFLNPSCGQVMHLEVLTFFGWRILQAVFQFTFFVVAATLKFDKVTDFAGETFLSSRNYAL